METEKTWFQTIKSSTIVKNFASLVENCYAKLPKLSKKKALAGSLLFLRGVSSYQGNSQELSLINNNTFAHNIAINYEVAINQTSLTLPNFIQLTHTQNHDPSCKLVPFYGEFVSSASSSDASEFIINNYKALDLDVGASEEEVKKAYKNFSLKWHPDKSIINQLTIEEATKNFQTIQNAYETLQEIFKMANLIENEDELIVQIQNKIENSEHNSITVNEHEETIYNLTRLGLNFSEPGFPNNLSVNNGEATLVNFISQPGAIAASAASTAMNTTRNCVAYCRYGAVLVESGRILIDRLKGTDEKQEKLDAKLLRRSDSSNDNATDGKINDQNKIDTWEEDIQIQTNKEVIETKRDIYLLPCSKQEESERMFEEEAKIWPKQEFNEGKMPEERESREISPKTTKSPREGQRNDGGEQIDQEEQSSSQNNQTTIIKSPSKNTFKEVVLPIASGIGVIWMSTLMVASWWLKSSCGI